MKIGVCDDDRKVRELICQKVQKLCPAKAVAVYESGEALLAEESLPDIIFLDIQMPPPDGMQTARLLRKRSSQAVLIFVTAFEEYVFDAFDVGAFYYLLKPFSDEKFAGVLDRAIVQCSQKECALSAEDAQRQLVIYAGGAHRAVRVSDIVYAEVFDRKIMLHTVEGDIEYYGRLKELQRQAGENFYRPHRSFLVNLNYVKRYNAATIWLDAGEVPVAKKQFPEFVRRYMQFIGEKGAVR